MLLHGPPMLVDKTKFDLVLYNHANFYRFDKTSSWSVKRISAFLYFSLVNLRHTSGITVYNRTVTNIEDTVRAVHSFNSWLFIDSFVIGVSCINKSILADTIKEKLNKFDPADFY